jgi:hypothetical protein
MRNKMLFHVRQEVGTRYRHYFRLPHLPEQLFQASAHIVGSSSTDQEYIRRFVPGSTDVCGTQKIAHGWALPLKGL